MRRINLTSRQQKTVALAAFGLAVLLFGDVLYQIGVHIAWRQWIPDALATPAATQPAGSQPADTQPAGTQPSTRPAPDASGKKPDARPYEPYLAIRKRNVFTPHQVAKHGLQLTGVIGRLALFAKGDQTVGIELGASEQGVKVVEIQGYEVTIEYQGKKETMKLFPDAPGGGKSGPPEVAPGPPAGGPGPQPAGPGPPPGEPGPPPAALESRGMREAKE